MTPTDEPLAALRINDAAAAAGISRRSIYREIAEGRLASIVVPTRNTTTQYIDPVELLTWCRKYRPFERDKYRRLARMVKKEQDRLAQKAAQDEQLAEDTTEGAAPCSVSSSDTENNSD